MNKKILFIFTDWSANEYRLKNNLYGGVSYYRIFQPARYLTDEFDITIKGGDIRTESEGKDQLQYLMDLIAGFDLVVTKPIDNLQAASTIAFICNHLNIPFVVDLDDDYFNLRKDQPGYKFYYPGSQHTAVFSAFISLASALFVSTEPLKRLYKERLKNVHNWKNEIYVLPNFNDINEFPTIEKEKNKHISIGYAGSTTHNSDLESILPAIHNVMKKNKDVTFDILGALNTKSAYDMFSKWDDDVVNRVSISAGTEAWDKYPELFMKQKFDIGIAPLIDDQFNRGKSHIKWMEYSMLKIPTIASNTYPYIRAIDGTKIIQHKKTGFIAKSLKDWEKYLQLLIDNAELRNEIGNNAFEFIKNNWQGKNHINKYITAINNIVKYTK